jgi:hypothetical protein
VTEKKPQARTNAKEVAYIKVVVGGWRFDEWPAQKTKKGGAETWQPTEILFDALHHLK